MLFGGLSVASRENIDSLLQRPEEGTPRTGRAVVVVIGGAQEALYARPGVVSLVLAKRLGLVKKSLQHGVPLVPCFAFGENDLFLQEVSAPGSWTRMIQDVLHKITTISFPLLDGRMIIIPRRAPVTVVVGAPVEVEGGPVESPTMEAIQEHHAKYVTALKELYEKHKSEYGRGETGQLEIC